jgi:hypothetical protein
MKKRYMFTLTAEHVEEFKRITTSAGLPPATLSNAIDDFLRDILKVMKRASAAGRFTVKDMFTAMGEQVELLIKEEREDAEKRKEEEKARIGR